RSRQDRASVHLLDQAISGENFEVPADGHVRDAQPLGQVADPCAAVAPDGLQDARLAVSGKHYVLPFLVIGWRRGRAGDPGIASSVPSETYAMRVRFRVPVSERM